MKLAELVNSNYSKLNENDLHIVKYILNNKKNCSKMGINELADKCNVSKSTVLRLTQKLGLSGYSEFKIFLKWEEEKNIEEDVDYLENMCKSVVDTIKINNENSIKETCKAIYEAERIFIYGTGRAQQMCVEEMKRLFLFSHKYFTVIEGVYEFESLIHNLGSKDVVIIVSLSGNTKNLDSCTTQLNMRGTKVISITKLENNSLASMTPYNLYGATACRELNSGVKHESTLFFYIIVELLFYNYELYVREINKEKGINHEYAYTE